MRHLSEVEMINLNKMLMMETNVVTKARMMISFINDDEMRRATETSILASEARIKGIQQFINENNVITNTEVH